MNQISTAGWYYIVMGTGACVFFTVAALGKWPDPGSGEAGFGSSGGTSYGRSTGSSSFGRTTGGFWGGGK